LPSQEVKTYYECLLKGIKVEPGKKDCDYRMVLRTNRKAKGLIPDLEPLEDEKDDDGVDKVILGEPELPPAKRRGGGGEGPLRKRPRGDPTPKPLPGPGAPGPSGRLPPPPVVDIGPLIIVDPPAGGGSASTSAAGSGGGAVDGIIMGSGDDEGQPILEREAYDFQPAIGDAKIVCHRYTHPVLLTTYTNWILKCPRHHRCYKKRLILPNHTKTYGDLEPVAYLHAWIDMDPMKEGQSHSRGCNPKLDLVSAYMAGHRDEVQEVVDRLLIRDG